VLIGLIAGLLVFYSIKFFDKIKVDDPILALSVHGAAGVWGTLSTGFFATPQLAELYGGLPGLFYGGGLEQLGVQALGVATSGIYAFIVSFVLLLIMQKALSGLRVTEEEEIMGLDLSEHGTYGYPELFQNKNNE
jgi:Amt family ammonium transporter